MQCPSCNHEAPLAAFGDPARCPECGIYYEKALALKIKNEIGQQPRATEVSRQRPPLKKNEVHCPGCGEAVSNQIVKCPSCGGALKPKKSVGMWVAMAIGFAVVVFAIQQEPKAQKSQPERAAAAPTPAPVKDPLREAKSMTDLDFKWRKDGGVIMMADFTITNRSPYAIKDFEIECRHFGASGTRIDSNSRTIYEIIPPGKQKTFKDFNMGFIHSQAESTNCVIADLKI